MTFCFIKYNILLISYLGLPLAVNQAMKVIGVLTAMEIKYHAAFMLSPGTYFIILIGFKIYKHYNQ
jgi:hypothetical protein